MRNIVVKTGVTAKKIDYYKRHGIPISYLRAGVQSLIMSLLHFFPSGKKIIILLIIGLIFEVIKIKFCM